MPDDFDPVVCAEHRKDITEIKGDLSKIEKALDGNGDDGFKTRLVRVEEKVKTIFNQNKSIINMSRGNMAGLFIAVIAYIIKMISGGG